MKIRNLANTLAEAALNNILPRHCVTCGCSSGAANLCPACARELPRVYHSCRHCGLPLSLRDNLFCANCLDRPPPWDFATAALVYSFPVDQLVCQFKFGRNLACGQILSSELTLAVQNRGGRTPGCILPVPLHRLRHFTRAFNQADVIARTVGRSLSTPVYGSILRRHKMTSAQSGLDAAARNINIKGAFTCRVPANRLAAFEHIALVDDVMTTGATLAECTYALKNAGAKTVSVWVAARAPEPHQLGE